MSRNPFEGEPREALIASGLRPELIQEGREHIRAFERETEHASPLIAINNHMPGDDNGAARFIHPLARLDYLLERTNSQRGTMETIGVATDPILDHDSHMQDIEVSYREPDVLMADQDHSLGSEELDTTSLEPSGRPR